MSSWGWAQSCSKHVEDSNKHIIEEIVCQVGHLPELYEEAQSEKYITHMNVPMTHVQQMESILLVATSTRHCCTTCEFQVHFNCNRITSSWHNSFPHQTHYSRQTQKLMNTWQNYLFIYIYIHFVTYSNAGLAHYYTSKIKTSYI